MVFCPPPATRGKVTPGKKGESGHPVDKVCSALGLEYSKCLHYAIAHLRRADGGLRPKSADNTTPCSMNLLCEGQRCWNNLFRCTFNSQNFSHRSWATQVHDASDRSHLRLLVLRGIPPGICTPAVRSQHQVYSEERGSSRRAPVVHCGHVSFLRECCANMI